MLKGKTKPEPAEQSANTNGGAPKENPDVNAKIDAYITNNPKFWDYVQSLSPERRARSMVLNQMQREERQERIQKAVIEKLDRDPALKQSYETIVKNLPQEQQEKAIAQLARNSQRMIARKQDAAKPSIRV